MRLLALSMLLCPPLAHADEFSWGGHIVRGNLGFVADGLHLADAGKIKGASLEVTGSATLFYGYEWGHQFENGIYLGGGLEWMIGYPRNFLSAKESTLPPAQLWLQPLTHIRFGYVFPHDVLGTVGLTYLWGLTLNVRVPIGDNFFVEAQWLQWLDGATNLYDNIGLPRGLASAIDLFNVSVGAGYRF